jgi:SAM-dependent methyltransferase
MKREGWEIDGVEVNGAAAERARALLRTPVVVGAFGPGQFHAGSFDLVTMWNVLEHLDRPQESLREIARLLKPGGCLVAQVPNLHSLEVRLTQDKASLLDLPRHFYHFEPATLSAMVRKAGLSVVRLVFPIEPTTLYTSLARKLGRLRALEPSRGHIWRRRLLWPLCAVLSWSGMGGQMAVIAHKPEGIE